VLSRNPDDRPPSAARLYEELVHAGEGQTAVPG
jgi:hypothetical protein